MFQSLLKRTVLKHPLKTTRTPADSNTLSKHPDLKCLNATAPIYVLIIRTDTQQEAWDTHHRKFEVWRCWVWFFHQTSVTSLTHLSWWQTHIYSTRMCYSHIWQSDIHNSTRVCVSEMKMHVCGSVLHVKSVDLIRAALKCPSVASFLH